MYTMDSFGTLQLYRFHPFCISRLRVLIQVVTLVASPDPLQVADFSPGAAASGKIVDHLNGRTNHG